jgi:hypothetical protein
MAPTTLIIRLAIFWAFVAKEYHYFLRVQLGHVLQLLFFWVFSMLISMAVIHKDGRFAGEAFLFFTTSAIIALIFMRVLISDQNRELPLTYLDGLILKKKQDYSLEKYFADILLLVMVVSVGLIGFFMVLLLEPAGFKLRLISDTHFILKFMAFALSLTCSLGTLSFLFNRHLIYNSNLKKTTLLARKAFFALASLPVIALSIFGGFLGKKLAFAQGALFLLIPLCLMRCYILVLRRSRGSHDFHSRSFDFVRLNEGP